MGTPQSLDDLALELMLIPISQFKERAPMIIKDYLAQGYGACMLKHPEAGEALEECFKHLCRRSPTGGVKP